MDQRKEHTRSFIENVIPWLVLAVLLVYTYAKLFQHPYLGFRVDSSGQVIFIFDGDQAESTLRVGDKLMQVNSLRWDDFRSDLRKTIFPRAAAGQIVSLLIERNDHEQTIPWKAIGPNTAEIVDLVVSEGWLAFFFWFAGTVTLLNLRPKDERWYLIIAFNYLAALLLAFGSGVSFYHIWGSAILLRIVIWWCMPVYLHLHWIFPRPFRKLPKVLLWLGYLSALLLTIAEWFQLIPRGLFYIGFLLAFGGSMVLLLTHAIFQPETRRDLRLLSVVALVSFAPSIVIGAFGTLIENLSGVFFAWIGGGALLSLPLLPLAYFYAVYRRQLGKLELRVNRLVTRYLFFTLLSVILFIPISLIAVKYNSSGATTLLAIGSVIIAGLTILGTYPIFESFVERRLFGIRLSAENINELYSTHITTSTSLPDLLHLLKANIMPSLLIQQFVFLQVEQETTKVLLTMGVTDEQLPDRSALSSLPDKEGIYLPPDPSTSAHTTSWIRLILPLKLDNVSIGFWLFGRRAPDDSYSQLEIPILKALANQTSIALSNILQTERLRKMYEANINRYEQERLRLAHDLHDSVLNELAAMMMNLNPASVPSRFQRSYEEVVARLREIVSDLRPPMLRYGLKLALEEIADSLSERNQDIVEIVANIQTDGDWRYPEVIENNLYRIVQEACGNALKYSQAKTITIAGRLSKEQVDISVEDDGIGLKDEISLKLDEMLANRHFGLAGIHERANLIGAEISINSKPKLGTQIQVVWMPSQII